MRKDGQNTETEILQLRPSKNKGHQRGAQQKLGAAPRSFNHVKNPYVVKALGKDDCFICLINVELTNTLSCLVFVLVSTTDTLPPLSKSWPTRASCLHVIRWPPPMLTFPPPIYSSPLNTPEIPSGTAKYLSALSKTKKYII